MNGFSDCNNQRHELCLMGINRLEQDLRQEGRSPYQLLFITHYLLTLQRRDACLPRTNCLFAVEGNKCQVPSHQVPKNNCCSGSIVVITIFVHSRGHAMYRSRNIIMEMNLMALDTSCRLHADAWGHGDIRASSWPMNRSSHNAKLASPYGTCRAIMLANSCVNGRKISDSVCSGIGKFELVLARM